MVPRAALVVGQRTPRSPRVVARGLHLGVKGVLLTRRTAGAAEQSSIKIPQMGLRKLCDANCSIAIRAHSSFDTVVLTPLLAIAKCGRQNATASYKMAKHLGGLRI
jgi:hypothetical protein